MAKNKIKKSMLATLCRLASLAKRGLAGWLVLFGAILTGAIIIMTLISPWIVPHDPSPNQCETAPGNPSPPNSQFPLGTDDVGRDMLSRVIAGGGVMLQVAIVSVLVCLVIGVPLGLFAISHGRLG